MVFLSNKPQSTEAKFLSLTFDYRLTRRPHFIQLRKRYLLALNILKIMHKCHHGPTSIKLNTLYQPILSIKNRLRIISIFIRLSLFIKITGSGRERMFTNRSQRKAFPTTPVLSLQSSTDTSPLFCFRNLLNINHVIHSLSKLPNFPYKKYSALSSSESPPLLSPARPHASFPTTCSCIFLHLFLLARKPYTHPWIFT